MNQKYYFRSTMEYHTNSRPLAGVTTAEVDRSWLYDDDEVCLTQSSFTAFQSPFRQVPGRITEITINSRNWAEKFAILLLPLGEYGLWQTIRQWRRMLDTIFIYTTFFSALRHEVCNRFLLLGIDRDFGARRVFPVAGHPAMMGKKFQEINKWAALKVNSLYC